MKFMINPLTRHKLINLFLWVILNKHLNKIQLILFKKKQIRL